MRKKKASHFIGRTTRVPASTCPACGRQVDAASPVDHHTKPEPGNLAICLYCGHLMAYADDLSLRHLTDAEMHEVAGDKRILAIQRARQAVKESKT
jgi:hypothetical protein